MVGHLKVSSQNKKKRVNMGDESPKAIRDTTKRTSICTQRDPERVEREQGEESLFKEVRAFLKPGEENGHRFKKPNRT